MQCCDFLCVLLLIIQLCQFSVLQVEDLDALICVSDKQVIRLCLVVGEEHWIVQWLLVMIRVLISACLELANLFEACALLVEIDLRI